MPKSYAELYSTEESGEHAAIVARRGRWLTNVEVWRSLPGEGAILCVVAEDHPGFLSLVSTALYLHEIDVTTAQIYSRRSDAGELEAVDFFWVRQNGAGMALDAERVASLRRVLDELVLRQACPDPMRDARPDASATEPLPPPRAFFETQPLRQGRYVLVIEAFDFPGLLMTVARALHREELDIVASSIQTNGARVHDRFTVRDTRGAPLGPVRLAAVRAAVASALRAGSGS